MDNTFSHHTDRITQIYTDAGVKLVYLPLYFLDLNPIEEFFVELKIFIKRNWQVYKANPSQGFDYFLKRYVDIIREQEQSAQRYFRHASLRIDDL